MHFSGRESTQVLYFFRAGLVGVQLQAPLPPFVLHTVCLYTCWVGHLPQRIKILTSLHSAHSFWNDSIFLILFSFRVCGFEAIWHPFSIVRPLRIFTYLKISWKTRAWGCLCAVAHYTQPKVRSNAGSAFRLSLYLIGKHGRLFFF